MNEYHIIALEGDRYATTSIDGLANTLEALVAADLTVIFTTEAYSLTNCQEQLANVWAEGQRLIGFRYEDGETVAIFETED